MIAEEWGEAMKQGKRTTTIDRSCGKVCRHFGVRQRHFPFYRKVNKARKNSMGKGDEREAC